MPTIVQLASAFAPMFERRKRDNGEEFVTLKDDAPQTLKDLVYDAHGNMLPDDHRYAMIEEAIDTIGNLPDGSDEDEASEALMNVEPPIYTAELTAWLASSNERLGYCDKAAEEFGECKDIAARIAQGWFLEFREVSDSVLNSLRELASADEPDTD